MYFLLSLKVVKTVVQWGDGGEWLSQRRKLHPKGKINLFGGNFKTSFQTVCSPIDLKESHIRTENTTEHAYFNCPEVSNAKHENLNAYSKFLLQSLILSLCSEKEERQPDQLFSSDKSTVLYISPRSGPALLMTCPPTWGPPQGGPQELPHTFESPNSWQWAAPKWLFRLAVGLQEHATWKNSCCLFYQRIQGVNNYTVLSHVFFFLWETLLKVNPQHFSAEETRAQDLRATRSSFTCNIKAVVQKLN